MRSSRGEWLYLILPGDLYGALRYSSFYSVAFWQNHPLDTEYLVSGILEPLWPWRVPSGRPKAVSQRQRQARSLYAAYEHSPLRSRETCIPNLRDAGQARWLLLHNFAVCFFLQVNISKVPSLQSCKLTYHLSSYPITYAAFLVQARWM